MCCELRPEHVPSLLFVDSQFERDGGAYLIFVFFFTHAKFLENKIYTEKRVNYTVNCQFFLNYAVNCQFFALNLYKFTPAKKLFHEYIRGVRDKYEVCMRYRKILTK